jgi:glycosyltransferase involved in cell wall biosynthesis
MRIVWVFERTDQLWGGVKVALTDANWLQAAGHDVTVVSRTARPSWMEIQCRFLQLEPLDARALPPADIYIGTFWTTLPAAAAAAALRGTISVHYCQGYEGDNPEFRAHRERIEQVYRLPGVRHLTIAPHLTALLRDRFGIRAVEVPYVIDHDVHFADTPKPPRARLRIGLVGPYEVPWKDIQTGLDACRLAAAAGQDLELVRVTNTAPNPSELELPFAVEWHQQVKPADMGAIYRSMDVFLGTSSGPEEGFFLPAVEAMACGVPCVLTDIPCFRAHGDGHYALFVPARDAAAMAEALVVAARVDDVRSVLRHGGLAAAARYTQSAHGEALLKALESVVARSPVMAPPAAASPTPAARHNVVSGPGHKTQVNTHQEPAAAGTAPVNRLVRDLTAAAEHAAGRDQHFEASRLFAAAFALAPETGDHAAHAAWCRHLAGDTLGALRMIDRFAEDGLDHALVHEHRAELQNGVGNPAAAAQSLRAAIAAGARSACIYNRLGVALYSAGDFAAARSSFERALLLEPGHRDAVQNIADLPAA